MSEQAVPSRLNEGGGSDPVNSSPQGKASWLCNSQCRQWLACVSAMATMFIVGTVYGWTTISLLPLTSRTDNVPLTLTPDEYSWVVSLTVLGSVIGPVVGAQLADHSGRKYCLVVCSGIFTVGWFIIYATTSVRVLYLARVIHGVGIGIAHTINPMYVSEVSDIEIRGILLILLAVNVYHGSLITSWVATLLTYKTLIEVFITISFISFLSNMYFPETPYFLVAKGRKKQACMSIAYYKDIADPEKVKIELRALRAQTTYELHPQSRYELHQQSRTDLPLQSRIDLPSQSRSNLPPQSIYERFSDPIQEIITEPVSDLNLPSSSDSPSIYVTHSEVVCDVHQQPTRELRLQASHDSHESPLQPLRALHSQSASELRRPSTDEIQGPSTGEVRRRSTSEIHRQSTSELPLQPSRAIHSQSASELHRPSTSEIQRPSTSEIRRRSTSELSLQPSRAIHSQSASEMQRPSTSEIQRPSTSEIQGPSTSEIQRPSTSEIQGPSTSEIQGPSTSEIQRPSTSEIQRPSTSEIQGPSRSEIHRSSSSQIYIPWTNTVYIPWTHDIHRPSTSKIHRPSTSEIQQPSTSEIQQPSTSEIQQPSTSEIQRPSTSEIQRPSRSEIHRSSSSQIYIPWTNTVYIPWSHDIHRPSTSQIYRPSTSPIYRPSTSEMNPDFISQIQSRSNIDLRIPSRSDSRTPSRSDSHTQSNVDSRAAADMDGSKYTWLTKLQVILQRSNKKALFIMLGLIMAQQLSGNFITTQYMEMLFHKTTIGVNPTEATIIVQAVILLSAGSAMPMVDRVKRRTLLILSTLGSCFTLSIVAYYLFLAEYKNEVPKFDIFPVIALIMYQAMFQIGLGTIPKLLICELFPTELRGFVGAIIVIFDSIIGFIVSKLYQVITDNEGSYTVYFIFATSCFFAFVIVYKWMPETKGKTYDEIEALLVGNNVNSSNEDVRINRRDIHIL